MIITSLNVCGVGGRSKKLSMKRLFTYVRPDVIFIQETIVIGIKLDPFFSQFLRGWEMVTVDANGCSSGLITTWNPKFVRFSPYNTSIDILISRSFTGIEMELDLLNCYGPYAVREIFWNRLRDDGILNLTSFIIWVT